MIIDKALYGLRTSGTRFHESLADSLRAMGFQPCYADEDVWMEEKEDHYEYVCVYVDDLMAMMKDPGNFFKVLIEDYKYTLKGVGPPEYHLGGNFFRDKDGTLAWGAKQYVEKILDKYERTYGTKPKMYTLAMEENCNPELNTSEFLDFDGIVQYQSAIGELQWAVTLGRFDILAATMTLSRFRIAPRTGQMDRIHRVY